MAQQQNTFGDAAYNILRGAVSPIDVIGEEFGPLPKSRGGSLEGGGRWLSKMGKPGTGPSPGGLARGLARGLGQAGEAMGRDLSEEDLYQGYNQRSEWPIVPSSEVPDMSSAGRVRTPYNQSNMGYTADDAWEPGWPWARDFQGNYQDRGGREDMEAEAGRMIESPGALGSMAGAGAGALAGLPEVRPEYEMMPPGHSGPFEKPARRPQGPYPHSPKFGRQHRRSYNR